LFAKLKYHILLHIIIFIWGFTGILGVLIHLESLQIVWWRVLIACVGLGIYLKVKGHSLRVKNKKTLLAILFVGILVGGHWVTFYTSIQMSTASLGILCLSTTTLHVTWMEPLIMKRRFLPLEFLFGLIIIGALIFIAEDFDATRYEAMAFGLLSAFLAAGFSVMNAKLIEETSSPTLTFYELLMGIGFVSILLASQGEFNWTLLNMSLSDLLWLLFLGIVCTSFAFLVVIDLVKRLGTFTVSLSINLEPVYTILLAIVILNENELLSTKFYVGSSIIVFVVIANAIVKYKMKAKNKNAFLRD
jgi:drug/metabolite transporter (DMT)-like permease